MAEQPPPVAKVGNARDDIIWAHPKSNHVSDAPVHRCTAALGFFRVTRDMLDPMALGVCRYCGRVLP